MIEYDKNISPVLIKHVLRFHLRNDTYHTWMPLTVTSQPAPYFPDDRKSKKNYIHDLPFALVDKMKSGFEELDNKLYDIYQKSKKRTPNYINWRNYMSLHKELESFL